MVCTIVLISKFFNQADISLAHITDIYSIAVTPTQVISASGSSCLKVHNTKEADYPLTQSLDGVHKLGCHHVVTSRDGKRAASAGFGGELRIWTTEGEQWTEAGEIVGASFFGNRIWQSYTLRGYLERWQQSR